MVSAILVLFALFLAACGSDSPRADGQIADGASVAADEPPPSVSEPDPGPLYEVNATVLEDKSHGPMLCLGAVLESLPPQCGDVPIANWDWRAVEREETVRGTTWGSYHIVGTYRAETFAVTKAGPFEDDTRDSAPEPDFATSCAEPSGGWARLDHATQEDARPAHAYARSQRDYVTSWVTHLDPAALEFGPVILNVLFTGDAERHEAEMRTIWAGPLCVVEREVPSARELDRIRKETEADLDELGVRMLWSQGPSVEPVIEIGVIVDAEGRAQAAFDARYGPGLVRLIPALERV